MWDNLSLGFSTALTPENLLLCFIGVLAGTIIGLLPGLGATTGVAVLLPLTFTLDPVSALIMLAGIYYGAQYGGTITSVLISTPGEPNSIMTTLDGYQMARRGRAGPALAIAAVGSFFAAIVSLILLALVAPPLAQIALKFGPPEQLALVVLGFVIISTVSGDSQIKGLLMTACGVLLATVGIDSATGTTRFTFGQLDLLSGISLIAVVVGLFALGEVLAQLSIGEAKPIRTRLREMLLSKEDLRRSRAPIMRGTGVGFAFGALPGGGSTLASFIAYGLEKRVSPNRAEFGKGAIEGVAAPESANNAAANANFIPTLVLGIPGGATTAVLLGAFTLYGITPGPLLFEQQPTLVWGLLASFFIGNVILLVLNLPMAPVFAQLLRLPYGYLYPLILCSSLLGAFAEENAIFDVWVAIAFGIVGYFIFRVGLPVAPLVIGMVLGALFEKTLVQTSSMGSGSFGILLDRPIALGILAVAALLLVVPAVLARRRRLRVAHTSLVSSESKKDTHV
ncbi:tripartite tricarboxylate transporter permease [Aeromicrobium piscarium]|uniref:Tripartite tricarboxylate transporter permease n=1 Tax=Aeromicrobium piscarium TaxID=2590901 RepID=A0A554S7I0_9ACTN|nr:tripartite tricarboxylate transporter permease [Aeromicrobium piscarium]TSD62308.1 tripartite tricarboxylate transporter permease [Aeromicrobium piscarium]